MKVLGIIFLVLLVGIITYLLIGAIMFYDALSDKDDRKDLATITAYKYVEMEAAIGHIISRKTFINMMIFGLILIIPIMEIMADK